MEMKIEDILKLEHSAEHPVYGLEQYTMFEPLSSLDVWGMEMETGEKITERNYVFDICNDGRSRAVKIVFYEEKPFAIYQYIGKGRIENEVIFDQDVYEGLIKDYIAEYLQKLNTDKMTTGTLETTYHMKNYDLGYFELENNKLVSKMEEK
jgi:hypothetical protein